MQRSHSIRGKHIDVKKALSKAEIDRAQGGGGGGMSGGPRGGPRGGPNRGGNYNSGGGGGGAWGNRGGPGGDWNQPPSQVGFFCGFMLFLECFLKCIF